MISLSSFLIVSALGAVILLIFNAKNKKKHPPGPVGWPLIGNLLELGSTVHVKCNEWGYKYGKIFRFKMGPAPVIMLSDPKLIREAFNDPNFGGRPDLESFYIVAGGKHGIIVSDGQEWLDQRRFTLRTLRDFGFAKMSMESIIVEEVNEYLEWLKTNEGKDISVMRQFSLAVLNSLWMILSGKRYSQSDPRLLQIFEQNTKLSEDLSSSPAIFVPSLAKLAPKLSGWDKLLELVDLMVGVCQEAIDEHTGCVSEKGDPPRDFIDAYLQEIRATTDPNSSFYKKAGDKSLLAVMTDMFSAGSDTTALTLTWSILYMCKFPHVQKKVQEELDSILGDRVPSLSDKTDLIYCDATMQEVLRFSSIAPIGVFHVCMKDTKFHGYDIPKGTWINPNQYHLHFSEEFWTAPKEFRPERHIVDGVVKRHEALMPFSVGKRACVGEALARDTFFMFFTSIFQKFDVRFAQESVNVSLEPRTGFLLPPQNFKVVVKERRG